MEVINLTHSITPRGHKHTYLERRPGCQPTYETYQYYESANLPKTAWALADNGGFILDGFARGQVVKLVNPVTQERAKLWTSTGEVEIEKSRPLKI